MKHNTRKFITTKRIVIPKGTEVVIAPHTVSRGVTFGSILIEHSKDSTGEYVVPIDEALELRLIKEV